MLFEAFYSGLVTLLTPPIDYYEVAYSIVKAVRQRRLAVDAGRIALEQLFDLALEVVGDEDAELALRAAYPVAEELNRSIYDGIFLAVSRAIGAPFVTADKPTWEAARLTFDVVYLPDLQLP
jgi:predicted nucleic acid-binding protein